MCLVFSLLVSGFCICLSTLFYYILHELYWSLSLESICVLNYSIKSFRCILGSFSSVSRFQIYLSKSRITGAEVVVDIADFLSP
jgi:hypothetical protein